MPKIGFFSLDLLKDVFVTNVFQNVIYDACDSYNAMCFTLLTVTNTHSIRKTTKVRNSKTAWKVAQKIKLLKGQKTEKSR